MKLRLLAVGTKMPSWVTEGFVEYQKRLPKNIPLELYKIGHPTLGQDRQKDLKHYGKLGANLKNELLEDLSTRTGLVIHKVDIISIDYLKDTAFVKAYYYSKEDENLIKTFADND